MIANKLYGPLFNATDTVYCNMLTKVFDISRKDYGRYIMKHINEGWWGEPHEALMYFLLQGGDIKELTRQKHCDEKPWNDAYIWHDKLREEKFKRFRFRIVCKKQLAYIHKKRKECNNIK